MVLYGFGAPSRATRVAWALEEVGADWSYVATSPRAPEVLARHPLGKLPLLVDGDLVLTESLACCLHVADRHPTSSLAASPGSDVRSLVLQWCAFAISELEQPLWTKTRHQRLYPEPLRADVMASVNHEFTRAVTYLSSALGEREVLVGDRFSCADILVVHSLRWARGTGFGDQIPDNVAAYARRHSARAALKRAQAREAGKSVEE